MTTNFGAVALCAAVAACLAWSAPSAQAKTRKECNAEWTANKATATTAGKTRRVFVAECRGLPVPSATPATLGKGQFKTEAEAKTSCPTDNVVWVNLRSKVYHASDEQELRQDQARRLHVREGKHGRRLPRAEGAPRSRPDPGVCRLRRFNDAMPGSASRGRRLSRSRRIRPLAPPTRR